MLFGMIIPFHNAVLHRTQQTSCRGLMFDVMVNNLHQYKYVLNLTIKMLNTQLFKKVKVKIVLHRKYKVVVKYTYRPQAELSKALWLYRLTPVIFITCSLDKSKSGDFSQLDMPSIGTQPSSAVLWDTTQLYMCHN